MFNDLKKLESDKSRTIGRVALQNTKNRCFDNNSDNLRAWAKSKDME